MHDALGAGHHACTFYANAEAIVTVQFAGSLVSNFSLLCPIPSNSMGTTQASWPFGLLGRAGLRADFLCPENVSRVARSSNGISEGTEGCRRNKTLRYA